MVNLDITPAERRVLDGILRGERNRAIAKTLGLSDKTVKNHIARMLSKTGCASRLDLVVTVYRQRERQLKRELRLLKKPKPAKNKR